MKPFNDISSSFLHSKLFWYSHPKWCVETQRAVAERLQELHLSVIMDIHANVTSTWSDCIACDNRPGIHWWQKRNEKTAALTLGTCRVILYLSDGFRANRTSRAPCIRNIILECLQRPMELQTVKFMLWWQSEAVIMSGLYLTLCCVLLCCAHWQQPITTPPCRPRVKVQNYF